MTLSKSRREVLLGAAALAGAASLLRVASAQAKGRIVVGTWGGDYARLLNKNIEAPLLIKDGWEVVQDQAGDPERRSNSRRDAAAARHHRRAGSFGHQHVPDARRRQCAADRLRQAEECRQLCRR